MNMSTAGVVAVRVVLAWDVVPRVWQWIRIKTVFVSPIPGLHTAIDEGIEKGATIGKPEDELGVIGRRVGAEAPSQPGSEDLPHKAFSTSTFFGAVVLAVFSAVERASGAMMAKLAAPPPTTPATSGLGFPPRPRIRPRPLDAVHYHHATTTKIEPRSVQQQKQQSMTAAMTNPTITMTMTTTTTTTPATTITTTTTTATTRRPLQGGQNDDDGDEATATTTMTVTSTPTHTTTSTKTKTKVTMTTTAMLTTMRGQWVR
ncbi:hypothetical protein EDB89DRAFT_1909774 [Lactarius sanguifluus]|nr:hypothetical protein EDB89DRAFT_1909774 [Lactarius sanguifluus]